MTSDPASRPRLEDTPVSTPFDATPPLHPTDELGKNVKFGWLAGVTTVYCCLTVLFGAWVRASFSGDGCGDSWPDCGGRLVPDLAQATFHQLTEFSHRVMSPPLTVLLALVVFFAFRLYPKGSAPRRAAMYAVVFTLTEIIVGALLVKFGWVKFDKSTQRAVMMPFHLVNTYLLTGNLAMLTYFGFTGRDVTWRRQGVTATALKAIIAGMVVLGCTGALSALGKTAFAMELASARTFSERLAAHLGESAPALLRGGAMHPVVATTIGLLILWMCGMVVKNRPGWQVKAAAQWVVGLYAAQFALGIVNLAISAPAWLQIVHLALAIADWLAVAILCAVALPRSTAESVAEEGVPAQKPTWRETVNAYIAVTKPRVISLLLFTTYAAMVVAQHGWPPIGLTLAVMLGGYMSAGAANAFNMLVERDLDQAMARTSKRPTLTGVLTLGQIQAFAWVLTFGSFGLLWWAANLLTAWMALCGLLTYVFVYTLWLKRRTWQNIVIGGAAGAFPPLVGYAAVSGHLTGFAWFLFALIFTWTPVHFWALAMLIKDDYAAANVPMLPVVKGDRVTVVQIMVYAVATSVLCVVPFLQRDAGYIYLVGSGLLNLGLLAQSLRLLKSAEKTDARALFKFSMAYLALIFIVIAADKVAAPSMGGSRPAGGTAHVARFGGLV